MNTLSLLYLVLVVVVLVSIVILLVLFFHEKQNAKLIKRFEFFSMKSNNEHEISFFDSLAHFFWQGVKKFSKIGKKSQVLKDYAKRYEKYIAFEEKEQEESMDFVTIKIFIGLFFVLLNLVVVAFKIGEGNVITYLFGFIIGFFLLDIALYFNYKKKRKEIEEDLLKAIMIMNNSFKSGKNIMQAISTVKNELEGPIADEFKKIYLDITYGLSLEVVFDRFYDRVKLEDAKYIASSLTLLNKTGGNITHVFTTIEKSFFNKKKLREELHSLTSSSIFVFRILVALPPLFTLIILILNPTYFQPLFQTPLGIIIFFFILILYICYIFIVRKVMEVKM